MSITSCFTVASPINSTAGILRCIRRSRLALEAWCVGRASGQLERHLLCFAFASASAIERDATAKTGDEEEDGASSLSTAARPHLGCGRKKKRAPNSPLCFFSLSLFPSFPLSPCSSFSLALSLALSLISLSLSLSLPCLSRSLSLSLSLISLSLLFSLLPLSSPSLFSLSLLPLSLLSLSFLSLLFSRSLSLSSLLFSSLFSTMSLYKESASFT